MRAGRPRHQFDGERGHAGGGDRLNRFERPQRPQKSDQDLAGPEQGQIGRARLIVRAIAEDLDHDVRHAEYLGAIRDNFRALGNVFRVREAGLHARPGFNDDFKPCFREVGDHRGHQAHTPFPRINLSRDTDNHEASSRRQSLGTLGALAPQRSLNTLTQTYEIPLSSRRLQFLSI